MTNTFSHFFDICIDEKMGLLSLGIVEKVVPGEYLASHAF